MFKTVKTAATIYIRLILYHAAQWLESRFQNRMTRKSIMSFLACHVTTATHIARIQNFCIFGNTEAAPTKSPVEQMLHVHRWPYYSHKF